MEELRLQSAVTSQGDLSLSTTFAEESTSPQVAEETAFEFAESNRNVQRFGLEPPPAELPRDPTDDDDFTRRFEFDVLTPAEALGGGESMDPTDNADGSTLSGDDT